MEGIIFVVGLARGDEGPDDSGQLGGAGGDAFGFAQASLEAADVFIHASSRTPKGIGGQAQDVGDAIGHFAGVGFEDASALAPSTSLKTW